MTRVLCPCENSACAHEPARCPNNPDPVLRVRYLGALCPACYAKTPEEYLEPGREAEREGRGS